jgi:hypothetical protein
MLLAINEQKICCLLLLFLQSSRLVLAAEPAPVMLDDYYFETTYKGRTAYYYPPRCCDIPSRLLDEQHKLICYPSGGFAGGDGKCPQFIFTESNSKKIIISKPRHEP